MKKILFTAVSALAMSAAIAADSTQFGVLKVPSKMKRTIVSVPWLESGTGTSDVSVSNLVLTAGLNEGDTLQLYQDGKYSDGWRLNASKQWEPAKIQNENSSNESGSTIAIGKAVMLTRTANPIVEDFYIMGKPTTTAGVAVTLGSGYTLIAPPSVADTDVNDDIDWTNIDNTDKLMIPVSDTSMVTLSWVATSKDSGRMWCKVDQSTGKNVKATDKIKMGTGAWFINSGKSSSVTKTFTLK